MFGPWTSKRLNPNSINHDVIVKHGLESFFPNSTRSRLNVIFFLVFKLDFKITIFAKKCLQKKKTPQFSSNSFNIYRPS